VSSTRSTPNSSQPANDSQVMAAAYDNLELLTQSCVRDSLIVRAHQAQILLNQRRRAGTMLLLKISTARCAVRSRTLAPRLYPIMPQRHLTT
jgi:hypothetical protein